MTVRQHKDGTYTIDTKGYEHVRYQKVYSHPRRYQAFKTSLAAARKKGLIFPSLDEAIALRCAANGQYNADKQLFTRTLLWQWADNNQRYVLLDNDPNPSTSLAFEHAADFCGNDGTLAYRKDTANAKLLGRLQQQKCKIIHYDPRENALSLEELAKDRFVLAAVGPALEPYKTWLKDHGHTDVSVTLPSQDNLDDHVLVHLVVLGTGNNLLVRTTDAFCQGIRQTSAKRPKPL